MTPVTVDTVAAVASYIERLPRQERLYAARVAAHLEEGARIDSAYLQAADHRAGVSARRATVIRSAIDALYTLTRDASSQPAEPAESSGARLTTAELRRALAAAGITAYNTLAGWQPLATFNPYGLAPADGDTPAGVNWRPGDRLYHGRIATIDGRPVAVVDAPETPVRDPFICGRFPVR